MACLVDWFIQLVPIYGTRGNALTASHSKRKDFWEMDIIFFAILKIDFQIEYFRVFVFKKNSCWLK